MSPDRWKQVKDIVGEVLELDPPSRPSAITRACGHDESLRLEVQRLVASFEGQDPADWEPPIPLLDQAARDDLPVFRVGDLVAGRYRVTAMLGRGGMGEVYEASDVQQPGDATVALKLVRWNRLGDDRSRRRLLREGTLAQRVNHPRVCRVLGVDEHATDNGALAVLVMERLTGETLAQRLTRGRCTLQETSTWARQMAEALQAAHDAGVVHRDFKPSNVMLTPDRGAVVMDFGLATASRAVLPEQTSLTSSGVLMGTLAYMSPEQLREQPATERSDQYALAAAIFEMLTGVRHSQEAAGVDEIARRLKERAPDVRQWTPEAGQWSKPLQRALAPDPDDRFASVREFLAEVDRRPRRWPWAAAAVLALGLGGFWWWNRLEGVIRLGLVADTEEARVLATAALSLSNFYRVVALPAKDWDAAATREKCAYVARVSIQGGSVKWTLDRRQGWRRQWECSEGATISDGVETCALRTRQWVGDPSLAEARYSGKLSEITTASPEALRFFLAGEAYARSSKRAEAVAEYTKAVNLDDGFAQAHRRLGDVLIGLNDYPSGISHYEKAVAAAGAGRASLCQTLHIRGMFSMDTGDRANARPAFEEYTRSCAPNPAIHFYLAGLSRGENRWPDAEREIAEASRLAPTELFVLSALARHSFLQRDSQALERRALAIEARGYPAVAKRWRALGLISRGQTAEARLLFGSLCANTNLAEDSSYGCTLLAHSLVEEGNLAEALRVLKKGAETDQKNRRQEEASFKLISAAWLAAHLGFPQEAQSLAFAAVENGSEPKLMSLSAVVWRLLRQKSMIVQTAAKLAPLVRYPRFGAALRRVEAEGAALAGDHAKALALILESAKLEPPAAERVTLARMYAAVGEKDRAQQILAEEDQRLVRWSEFSSWLPGYRKLAIATNERNDLK